MTTLGSPNRRNDNVRKS